MLKLPEHQHRHSARKEGGWKERKKRNEVSLGPTTAEGKFLAFREMYRK